VFDSDFHLDAQLRDVPLPDGFAERLKAALLPSNERLDAGLAAVAVPSTVLARLKEIPGDVAVDEALTDFVSSPALIHSLRLPTWSDRAWQGVRRLQQLAVAAAWFVALSAALAAGLRSIISGTLARDAHDSEIVFIYDQPVSLAASAAEEAAAVHLVAAAPTGELLLDVEPPADATPPIARIDPPSVDGPPSAGPVAQWVSLVSAGLRPLDDAMLLRYGVLASPQYSDDRMPELTGLHAPRPAGIEPPPVRGYDRAFFLKNRVFPPIAPAAHPRLAELGVPLVVSSEVLSQIERSLAEGRVPDSQEVRVEDLIASMDYRLPAARPGQLGLRTAGGPAVFGPPESGLLLVGVQAGGFVQRPQPVTHVVIALDLSQSMSRGGRLAIVQQAIVRLLDQLDPRDRLSLVVFGEEVTHVVEAASRNDAASIRQLLDGLTPRGGTNLAAGLQRATSLAMTDAAGPAAARRLVLVTDSQTNLPADARAGVLQMLLAARDVGVRLDVLDLSRRSHVDSTLLTWCSELSGDLRQVHDARQMQHQLLEALLGTEPTIARDARLKLHFNPQTVAAYRLVGHESNALADLTPPAVEAEFAAGEATAALVEVWFQPGDGDDLGYVELTWNDPAGGPAQTVRQRLSRLQFAPSLAEAPVPLVQAALAAEVGEILRGSQVALRQAGVRPVNQRGLTGVLEIAEQANSQLRQRPDLQRLLGLVRQLKAEGIK
jgi:hypothetical protein